MGVTLGKFGDFGSPPALELFFTLCDSSRALASWLRSPGMSFIFCFVLTTWNVRPYHRNVGIRIDLQAIDCSL